MSDTIIKVANKTENFTIISNEVPRDNTISARAKGVYFYLMTLPKDWKIHKEEIYSHFAEGREALDTAWNELKDAGYIEKEILKEKGKITGTEWKVYEARRITEKPSYGNPVTRKPSDGKPVTGNPQLLSTNGLSTNELSTDNKEDTPEIPATPSKPKREKKEFIPPTLEEVENYVIEKQLVINPKDFIDYYSIRDWHDSQDNKVGNWKNRILDWHGRELKKNPDARPYSKPVKQKEYSKIEKQVCPKCGKPIEFGQCVDCGIFVGLDGKEVIL